MATANPFLSQVYKAAIPTLQPSATVATNPYLSQILGAVSPATNPWTSAAGATSTIPAVGGAGGSIANNWSALFGKIPGGAGTAAFLLPLMLELYAGHTMDKFAKYASMERQTQHVKDITAMTGPDELLFQSMMPELEQENKLVQTLLLQQLMGANRGPQLARGETVIGGQ